MRVLFVCVENSCRSVMAETVFNSHAKRWRAESAGLRKGSSYDPRAIDVLRSRGYDVKIREPREVGELDLGQYDVVVTVCDEGSCVTLPHHRIEAWKVEDPKGKDVAEYLRVLKVIEGKVLDLIRRLEDEGAGRKA